MAQEQGWRGSSREVVETSSGSKVAVGALRTVAQLLHNRVCTSQAHEKASSIDMQKHECLEGSQADSL